MNTLRTFVTSCIAPTTVFPNLLPTNDRSQHRYIFLYTPTIKTLTILLSSKFEYRGILPQQLYLPVPLVNIRQRDLTYGVFRKTLIACNGIRNWNLLVAQQSYSKKAKTA